MTTGCHAVLEQGGERALKKLLQHRSEEVQQFAAGALANLQLYRRNNEEERQSPSQIGGQLSLLKWSLQDRLVRPTLSSLTHSGTISSGPLPPPVGSGE